MKFFESAKNQRYALWGFATLLFFLISFSIHISMLRVPFETYVYGSNLLVTNSNAGFRLAVFDPTTKRFLSNLSCKLHLVFQHNGRDYFVYSGSSANDTIMEINFTVPHFTGKAHLIGTLQTPNGDEFLTIPVTISSTITDPHFKRIQPQKVIKADKYGNRRPFPTLTDGTQVSIYPAQGAVTPMYKNQLFLWASKQNQGIQTKLYLQQPQSLVATDSWGIASIIYDTNRYWQGTLEFKKNSFSPTNDSDTDIEITTNPEAKVMLDIPSSQITLTLNGYIVASEDTIKADIYMVRSSGRLYIDVWHGNHVIETTHVDISNNKAQWQCELPPEKTGLFLIHTYRPFNNPGQVEDSQVVYVYPKHQKPDLWKLVTLVRELPGKPDPFLDWLAQSKPMIPTHKGQALGKLLTSRVANEQLPPPVIYNSGPLKHEKLDKQKSTIQRNLQVAYILATLVALTVLGFLFIQHHIRTKQNVLFVLDEEEQNLDESSLQITNRIVRIQTLITYAMIFGVIALGLWAIFVLIANLQWN